MHTHSLARVHGVHPAGDWAGRRRADAVVRAQAREAGADFLICPDNTVHQAFPHVEPRSPLPWLHIADVVADQAVARRLPPPRADGTRWLVESDVYPERLTARGARSMSVPTQPSGSRSTASSSTSWRMASSAPRPSLLPARHRADAGMTGCDGVVLGLHRDPARHERFELPAADARFHAPPRASGAAPGRARRLSLVLQHVESGVPVADVDQPVLRDEDVGGLRGERDVRPRIDQLLRRRRNPRRDFLRRELIA